MAIRDQPVGLNIYARTQATHRAFRVGYQDIALTPSPGISQAHRQRLRILPQQPSGNATPISSTSGTDTPPDHFRAPPDLHLTDAQFR